MLYKDITLSDNQNINIVCDENVKSIYLESIFSKIDILKIVFFMIILFVIITTVFVKKFQMRSLNKLVHISNIKNSLLRK